MLDHPESKLYNGIIILRHKPKECTQVEIIELGFCVVVKMLEPLVVDDKAYGWDGGVCMCVCSRMCVYNK